MPPQRYVIVALLLPLTDGYEFLPDNYPLHITLVPSFQLEVMADSVLEELKQLCTEINTFTLTAGKDEHFGPNKEVPVTTVSMNDALYRLHTSLVHVLSDAGAIFDEPQYMLKNYRPHATVQELARLHDGDVITVEGITIIDKLPNGNPNKRKVLKTLNFSKK